MNTRMNEHEYSTNTTDAGVSVEVEQPPSVDKRWLYILVGVTLIQLVYLISIAGTNVYVSRRAITNLHREMFSRVLYATMTFFDSSPTGKILNNFSRDLNMLDENLLPISLNFLVGKLTP